MMIDEKKLKDLQEKLAKYRAELAIKKRNFRGIKHEDSLSEMRYTEYRVYQDMVDGLEKEIAKIKRQK